MSRLQQLHVLACLVMASLAGQAFSASYRYPYDFSNQWEKNHWMGEWEAVPGHPKIPTVTATLLIPYGEKIESIEWFYTEKSSQTVPFEFEITPYPKPMCEGETPRSSNRFFKKKFYPDGFLGTPVSFLKHGFQIVNIPLYPVRYLDSKKQGWEVERGELVLTTIKAKPPELYRGFERDAEEVSRLVENAELLETYPILKQSGSVDYLVIGPDNFLKDSGPDSLASLLAEKQSRGLRTEMLSLETIKEDYEGKDLQEQIRNAIRESYENGVQYVLLVGNGNTILPTKKLSVSGSVIPADFYFACLDGEFATTATSDLTCEVALGRAPASNLDDVHVFVRKTLAFQKLNPSNTSVGNALLYGERMDGYTLGQASLEKLASGGTAGGIPTVGFPDHSLFTRLYETQSTIFSAAKVLETLSDGDFYTVHHLGHANPTFCMRFKSSQIPELENTIPFFGITQSCHAGDLSVANWASALVNYPDGGASSMIANSNYGWYQPGGSDGPSNRFHLAFYDTLFREKITKLGKIHFRAKERLIPQVTSQSLMRWVVYETNLLGDPESDLHLN